MARALLALLAALSAGHAIGASHRIEAHGAAADGCGTPGDHSYTLVNDGLTRKVLLHVPKRYQGGAVPLVVGLGGAGDTGPDFASFSGMSAQADKSGFAAVYPTATGKRPFWNISASDTGADDVGLIRNVIDDLEERHCADPDRVFVTGISNGGGMTALVGCALADKIAAIAPVAGGYRSLPACRPARRISVLEIHGSRDPIVPYAGIPPDRLGSVPRFLVSWALRDGCSLTGKRRDAIGPATVRTRWVGCKDASRVWGIKLYGAGHVWPGRTPPEPQGPSKLRAAPTIWKFFTLARASPAP